MIEAGDTGTFLPSAFLCGFERLEPLQALDICRALLAQRLYGAGRQYLVAQGGELVAVLSACRGAARESNGERRCAANHGRRTWLLRLCRAAVGKARSQERLENQQR
jgi:hypothetical protein